MQIAAGQHEAEKQDRYTQFPLDHGDDRYGTTLADEAGAAAERLLDRCGRRAKERPRRV